jgi:GTP-binding protein EngB required for normal cell division
MHILLVIILVNIVAIDRRENLPEVEVMMIDPTAIDLEMVEFLAEKGLPTLVVLTKMDKLKHRAREKAVATAVERLKIDEDQVLSCSSKTGEGREELLAALDDLIGAGEA